MNVYGIPIDPNIILGVQWILALAFILLIGWGACVAVWAITIRAGKWYEQIVQEKRFIGNNVQADTQLYSRMKDLEFQKAKELQDLELQEVKAKRKMSLEREKAQHSLITEELKGMADETSPVVPISSKAG
jgi:hypothetical protein